MSTSPNDIAYFRPAPTVDTGIPGGPILAAQLHDDLGELTPDRGRYIAVVSLLAPSSQKLAAAVFWSGAADYIEVIDVDRGRLTRVSDSELIFVDDSSARAHRDSALRAAAGIRMPVLVDTRPDDAGRRRISNDVYDLPWRIGTRLGSAAGYLGALRTEPESVRAHRLRWEQRIFTDLHAGVYRAGFLERQSEYERQVLDVAGFLADLDAAVAAEAYLGGAAPGLADLWAFTLLVRFDHVYGPLFRLHALRLTDYPALLDYVRRLYRDPVLRATTDFDAITLGYYYGISSLRRSVVPLGVRDRYLLTDAVSAVVRTTARNAGRDHE
ncbi:glutathione S-transferase [Nocardia sp. SYP-A9097]|uniref:glutathione S-transferase C-terminal domain-containing protein n=1 Tax=Nocardia sp. SYP-A9097 TaxID=2663237 RepID=UPI00129B86D6|nr:glutathione S-transferase C-terminal domain-containing protein [Nocardia sp. SYP-A9097]MRH89631.1 glutathione S-transferase [Nocardia sp. SYP-A9097]